jgi:hypothetical protein
MILHVEEANLFVRAMHDSYEAEQSRVSLHLAYSKPFHTSRIPIAQRTDIDYGRGGQFDTPGYRHTVVIAKPWDDDVRSLRISTSYISTHPQRLLIRNESPTPVFAALREV